MIKTHYGEITDKMWASYKQKLVNMVYKILPLKEENSKTIDTYIESLIFGLMGAVRIAEEKEKDLFMIIGVLHSIKDEQDLKITKREVFNCISLINKL